MSQTLDLSGNRVLLVEDEPRLREMLLRALREMGFDPTGVATAEQALRILEHRPFPVIVADLNLPVANGLELIRAVRQRSAAIQAIILTGFGDLDAARQAIHLDVVDFLTKPCELSELELAVTRAFRRLVRDHPTALAPRGMDSDEVEDETGSDRTRRPRTAADRGEAVANPNGQGPQGAPVPAGPEVCVSIPEQVLSIDDLERRAILAALEKHGGNRNAAAEELGISSRKLYYRLAQYQKQGLLRR